MNFNIFFRWQSISPGMVDTDFLSAYSTSFYAGLPRLKADDVTGAVLYALSTSEHTQVMILNITMELKNDVI